MNGTSLQDDIARARALGIVLRVSASADRATDPLPRAWPSVDLESAPIAGVRFRITRIAPGYVFVEAQSDYSIGRRSEDWRGDNACPTCDDGIRTIEYPILCRECENMKGDR